MNYEKKYKEALERAKDSFNYPDFPGFIRADVVFPELKESEDEKIKREIINYFKCQSKDEPCRKDIHNKWIAWLEKQAEEKPNYCHHEVDLSNCSEEYRKAYYDGWNNCNQQHEQLKAEQKPAWNEDDEKAINDIMWIIETYRKNGFNETHTQMADDSENWLKALEERLK